MSELNEKKPTVPKEWHPQQAKLLKSWAEVASSYRWMHNQAYMIYKKKNLYFMLPLIIMSTVAGTANFAQATFPMSIQPYVPQVIGAINLISAIMTTIYQFLKISEYMESHRISSINYGKFARTITVELNLPVKDRNDGGAECVKVSRNEIDRLIEQSPSIPKSVLYSYERQFAGRGLSEPEIIVINKVDVYEDQENKVATTVAEAGLKLKNALSKTKKPLFQLKSSESPTERRKENLKQELSSLPKLVSTVNTNVLNNIIGRFGPRKEPTPVLPEFTEPEPEPVYQEPVPEFTEPEPEPEPPEPEPEPPEPEPEPEPPEPEPENDEITVIIDEIVEDVVASTTTISDDLELLRTSKLVTGKK